MKAHPYPIGTVLCVTNYIKLPQESRAMTNRARGAYNLVSFLGVDELCTLTPPEVQVALLDACLQDGPILLKTFDFHLSSANTNLHDIALDIERKILKLALHQLCSSVFVEISPGIPVSPTLPLSTSSSLMLTAPGT
jgi:hypothetical protein